MNYNLNARCAPIDRIKTDDDMVSLCIRANTITMMELYDCIERPNRLSDEGGDLIARETLGRSGETDNHTL